MNSGSGGVSKRVSVCVGVCLVCMEGGGLCEVRYKYSPRIL